MGRLRTYLIDEFWVLGWMLGTFALFAALAFVLSE